MSDDVDRADDFLVNVLMRRVEDHRMHEAIRAIEARDRLIAAAAAKAAAKAEHHRCLRAVYGSTDETTKTDALLAVRKAAQAIEQLPDEEPTK